jgi:D-cysteine desulfhydrase
MEVKMSITTPKLNIGFFPTPIHRMQNMEKHFGKGKMYIKRDDLTGFGLGGNKIRKIEYILKDAMDKGYEVIATYGGVQTNHGRLVAALCAKLGLKPVIICSGKRPDVMSGNLLLDKIFGADLYFMDLTGIENMEPDMSDKAKASLEEFTTKKVAKKYEDMGKKVYFMPMGGYTHLGNMGYVEAAMEINRQIQEQNLKIDYVVCANGSGGTYTGMVLGAKYCNAPFKVLGINVFYKSDEEINRMVEFANQTSEINHLGIRLTLDDFNLSNDFLCAGYNIPDKETRKYVYLLGSKEGLLIDPCYTGKAFMGYCSYIENGIIPPDANSLFLHTGGTPGLYSKEHLDCMQEELWSNNDIEYSSKDIDIET